MPTSRINPAAVVEEVVVAAVDTKDADVEPAEELVTVFCVTLAKEMWPSWCSLQR